MMTGVSLTAVGGESPVFERVARVGSPEGYLPIVEHGIVGDMHSAALVGVDGTIDWYCPARSTGRVCSRRCSIAPAGGTTGSLPWARSRRRSSSTCPTRTSRLPAFSPAGTDRDPGLHASGRGRSAAAHPKRGGFARCLRFGLEVEPRFDYGARCASCTSSVWRAPAASGRRSSRSRRCSPTRTTSGSTQNKWDSAASCWGTSLRPSPISV